MKQNVIGNAVGRTIRSAKESYVKVGGIDGLNDRIDKINEKIVNNSWLSLLFGRHTPDEIESVFMVGTCTTTPDLKDVDVHFPKPWVFFRMLSCSVLLYVAFSFLYGLFGNANMIPAQLVIGAVAVPASVLCLFFEMNVVRNVSVYRVARFVLVGGMIAFLYALFMYLFQSDTASVFWAGPIEELGKLLAMIVIAEGSGRLRSSHLLGIVGLPFDWLVGKGVAPGKQYQWTLNGLLFGAAVGVGFAAFETMGYALNVLLVCIFSGQSFDDSVDKMKDVILLRGVLSPFAHVVWSAICGGALWSVRGADEWRWKKLFHLRLLLFFGMAAFLHGLWDVACRDPNRWLWFAGIGVTSWVVVLFQVGFGVKQVRKCQEAEKRMVALSNIPCPHCGCEYQYDTDLIGTMVQCSSCGKEFVFQDQNPSQRDSK